MRLSWRGSPRRTSDPAAPPRVILGAPGLVASSSEEAWSVPLGVRTASEWAWRGLVIGVAAFVVLWGSTFISELVIPIIVALLLTALLQPVFHGLGRVMPPGLAAFITVIGTLGVISGLLSFVGSQLVSQLDDITTKATEGLDQVRTWLRTSFGVTDTQIQDYLDRARAGMSSSNLTDTATAAGLTATHVVTGFFLALFSLFFFLKDGPVIWGWLVRLFPRAARERAHSSGLIAWGQLSAFTRATLLVAAVDAIGIGTGAAILGVPFASGIALLVFFGAFIPVVGAAISGSVAILLALVALGPVQALIMLGVVVAVQQLESHILQPLLIGRAMKIHPLAVIFAIAAGLILAGIIGGLIAVPTVAVLNAVGHHLLDSPDEPEPAPTEPTTAEDLLDPEEEAQARDEADAVEEQAEAASRERLEPGHS
ncbi:MAG: AI-2E family transporter [Ornithinibacter sp.]